MTVSPLIRKTDGAVSGVVLRSEIGKYSLLITYAEEFLTAPPHVKVGVYRSQLFVYRFHYRA